MFSLDEIVDLVQSSSTRSDFLDNLPSLLNRYEWRQLASTLATKKFDFDIVGGLPLDIVTLIFQYLPPISCFRNQRVCKAWRAVLSEDHLQRACLRPWFSENDPPLAGESQVAPEQVGLLRAKQAVAFRRGIPFSSRLHQLPSVRLRLYTRRTLRREERSLRQLDFCGHHFAWVEESVSGDYSVRVYNLHTGRISDCRGQGRERMLGICLTLEMVSWVTFNGLCYAQYLSDQSEMQSIRLPSANVRAFAGRGRCVLLLLGKMGASFTACLWDTSQGSTHSFEVPEAPPPSPSEEGLQGTIRHFIALVLGQDVQSFAMIDCVTSWEQHVVQFRKFSLLGSLLASGKLVVATAADRIDGYTPNIHSVTPLNNDGQYICLVGKEGGKTAIFDYNADRLVLVNTPQLSHDELNEWKQPKFIWKGCAFRRRWGIRRIQRLLRTDTIWHHAFGNDRITVEVHARVERKLKEGMVIFHVQSFDPHIQLPQHGDDLDFDRNDHDFGSELPREVRARLAGREYYGGECY